MSEDKQTFVCACAWNNYEKKIQNQSYIRSILVSISCMRRSILLTELFSSHIGHSTSLTTTIMIKLIRTDEPEMTEWQHSQQNERRSNVNRKQSLANFNVSSVFSIRRIRYTRYVSTTCSDAKSYMFQRQTDSNHRWIANKQKKCPEKWERAGERISRTGWKHCCWKCK